MTQEFHKTKDQMRTLHINKHYPNTKKNFSEDEAEIIMTSKIDTNEARSQMERWDDESKEHITPKYLLQYIQKLRISENGMSYFI